MLENSGYAAKVAEIGQIVPAEHGVHVASEVIEQQLREAMPLMGSV